jgi:hypothetical protein
MTEMKTPAAAGVFISAQQWGPPGTGRLDVHVRRKYSLAYSLIVTLPVGSSAIAHDWISAGKFRSPAGEHIRVPEAALTDRRSLRVLIRGLERPSSSVHPIMLSASPAWVV